MNNPNSHRLPEANPVTQSRHRKQMWGQILLPVLAAAATIIVLAVLVATAATDQVVRFSDISIILLILPTALISLVILALFGGLIFISGKALALLPAYARLAQIYLGRATEFLKSLSDKAAGPVVTVESAWAGVKSVFQRDHRGEETL